MKRTLKWLLGILFTCILAFGLAACEEDSSSSSTGIESDIAFKTLQVDGTDVYGKVSNSTETFSFLNEVTESNNAKYIVSLDIYGIQKVATKTIPLYIGDNTVYITEIMNDEPITVYTVTIRRRPIYEVTFTTNGGTAVESQIVEEDGFATQPETTRAGYTFKGWNYDFTQPIIGNTTVSASWTAHTDIPYKVEYYLQNLENDNYTLKTTENKIGVTDTTVNAEIKSFAHFTPTKNSVTGNISPDGSLVLKVYYRRNQYTVTFDGNGGTLISGKKTQTVKYGGSVTAPTYSREGYTFTGFDKTNYTNISESFTVTAGWQINQYTLTIVYNNGQDNLVLTQDYNTMISVANPERLGYGFTGWDKTIPTRMPDKNQTITAQWSAIYILSGNTITGLTSYGKSCSELIVPPAIDGVIIKDIKSFAFENNASLTSVTIPDSIISIGFGALENCIKLEKITLPFAGETKDGIGNDYFGYIFGASNAAQHIRFIPVTLKKVTITSATSIGEHAFSWCENLTNISIYKGVTSIGDSAFSNCSSLKNIIIPDSVTAMGEWVFSDCDSLTSVTIGNSVTRISSYAFYSCDSLTSVTIGNSVTTIGEQAFLYCNSLTSVYITDITAWCNISFSGYDSNPLYYTKNLYLNNELVTELVIPDSVTTIGNYAFRGCKSLTSVTIGNSVTTIGEYAFSGCKNLTSISFEGTREQWKAITKGFWWNYNAPISQVICSDGVITL